LDASYGGAPKVTIAGSDRGNGNTNGGTSAPEYSYTAIPWESVEAAVTGPCGAGATLLVNGSTGAVSCGGNTSALIGQNALGGYKSLVSVKGRVLSINTSADSKVGIRVVDMRGKTVAKFNTHGGSALSLKKIPAGSYIIEAKRINDGTKMTSSMVLR
jgi:hypothetical protein